MSRPSLHFNSFTSMRRDAWNTGENDKPCFLSGDKDRIDEEGDLFISSIASRESDITSLFEIFHSEMSGQEQELEVAAREMEEKYKSIEEDEIRKREREESESENARLEAEEYLKEEEQRFKEEEEQMIRDEEQHDYDDLASSDKKNFKDALQHPDEIFQMDEEAENNIISHGDSSKAKFPDILSTSVIIDQPQMEQSEDYIHEDHEDKENIIAEEKEDDPEATTTDRPSRETIGNKGFNTEPYLRDVLHRIQKMEKHQKELKEDLEEARNMNKILARLGAVERNVRAIKKEKFVEVSESTSLLGEDSDGVVGDEREEGEEQTNEKYTGNEEIKKIVGAHKINTDLNGRANDELDRSDSGENTPTRISLDPKSSIDGISIITGSRLNSDSTANNNTSGTDDKLNSGSDSGTHSIDASEREEVEDNKLQSRLDALEETVRNLHIRKLDKASSDGKLHEEILRRLSTIEENEKRAHQFIEKGHRLEMEKIQALLQQIESSQKMELPKTQKCTSAVTSASRDQPKKIASTLVVEELVKSVHQTSASASKSSRDATLAATAAHEAEIAAKSAADAHAALLRKTSSDDLKKTSNVSLEEIERAIKNHPSVKTARAFGVPDRNFGMDCCCVVDLKPRARVTQRWLSYHAQCSLPAGCVPKFLYKKGLNSDEDRKSLATDKELLPITEYTGTGTPVRRFLGRVAWSPRFRRRRRSTDA